MEKRYSIGTFTKMTNMTPRTLHYYDEKGFLSFLISKSPIFSNNIFLISCC